MTLLRECHDKVAFFSLNNPSDVQKLEDLAPCNKAPRNIVCFRFPGRPCSKRAGLKRSENFQESCGYFSEAILFTVAK